MTRKLNDVTLEKICAEHYLFDLGYPIEKVSEICGMDEEIVRKIYNDYKKYTLPGRSVN